MLAHRSKILVTNALGFEMIITIDGPAAAGKGTLASKLAEKYNLAYFDTGMVYRAVGLKMLQQGFELSDAKMAEEMAKGLTFPEMIKLSQDPEFRSPAGGNAASCVSAIPEVRQALLKMQQDFALSPVFSDGTPTKGVVYDGRDTGTTVCPNADIKLFMVATPEVRAMRRFKEFQAKGIDTTFEKVLEEMKIRDERDSQRAASPLKPAEDAIIFDTSTLSIDEAVAKACEIIENR